MTTAIVLNVLTIEIILRVRSLRQNLHNLLILNLSISDLGVALFSMTFALVSVLDCGQFLESNNAACQVILNTRTSSIIRTMITVLVMIVMKIIILMIIIMMMMMMIIIMMMIMIRIIDVAVR